MKPSKNRWMLSFSDLVTLILAFFVMMYSAKSHDIEIWNNLKESTNNFFNNKGRLGINIGTEDYSENTKIQKRNYDLNYYENLLKSLQIESKEVGSIFTLKRTPFYLEITFNNKIDSAKKLIDKITIMLLRKNNKVEIQSFEYSQEKSLETSKKIIDFFNLSGLSKTMPIKLGEEVFLPETADTKQKIGMVSLRIYANDE